MDRRLLIVSGLAAAAAGPGRALAQNEGGAPPPTADTGPTGAPAKTYSRHELLDNVSDFFGVTAETAGSALERIFKENGQPTAYIAGTEGSGAFVVGARYGQGLLYMKERPRLKIFWQGPSGGFDFGANASRVFPALTRTNAVP